MNENNLMTSSLYCIIWKYENSFHYWFFIFQTNTRTTTIKFSRISTQINCFSSTPTIHKFNATLSISFKYSNENFFLKNSFLFIGNEIEGCDENCVHLDNFCWSSTIIKKQEEYRQHNVDKSCWWIIFYYIVSHFIWSGLGCWMDHCLFL